jgi:sulfate/thiosulfate transport system substrate-binding protein
VLGNAQTHDLSTAQGVADATATAAAAKAFAIYDAPGVQAKIADFFNNHVPVLDAGARGATVSFAQKQLGDVLLNWENELWLAREEFGPDKFDIVYPPASILTEPPVAVVDKTVERKGTRAAAEAYLQGLYTPEAQELIGELHYRPRDLAALKKFSAELPSIPFFTINETFGGWEKAHTTFFADGGTFDKIYHP